MFVEREVSKISLQCWDAQIVKDFGHRDSLPSRPLPKSDSLARYNSLKVNHSKINLRDLSCHNVELTDRQVAAKLVNEIKELYKEFGLNMITRLNARRKWSK